MGKWLIAFHFLSKFLNGHCQFFTEQRTVIYQVFGESILNFDLFTDTSNTVTNSQNCDCAERRMTPTTTAIVIILDTTTTETEDTHWGEDRLSAIPNLNSVRLLTCSCPSMYGNPLWPCQNLTLLEFLKILRKLDTFHVNVVYRLIRLIKNCLLEPLPLGLTYLFIFSCYNFIYCDYRMSSILFESKCSVASRQWKFYISYW